MNSEIQYNLFNDNRISITISEAAKLFSVSTATIRNWIKVGDLKLIEKSKIDLEYALTFKQKNIGKNKLNQRANKSQKESHNHQELSSYILKEINNIEAENLSEVYENRLSDSYKNKEGIYYTPTDIVIDLFKIFDDVSNKTFCDPCCGSGNFILRAIDLGFKPENIYGFDIDPIAVEITKKRLYKKTGYVTNNIKCIDFLKNKNHGEYDYIYTNPPWGKKIDKNEKEFISKRLQAKNMNDTCSLFFLACLNALNNNGVLGLLLPESFYNVASFESSREELLKFKIEFLIDYGKIFKGLQVGAVAFILKKTKINHEDNILCKHNNKLFYRTRGSFLDNPKKIINIYCNDEDEKIIRYLFSIPHITLKNNAKWGLGIVTGNNKKHIKSQNEFGYIPIFKGSDITENGIKSPTHFIFPEFSSYQQVAPLEIFMAEEKIIYRFISSDLVFYYDTEKRFVLNSANILITNDDFPLSMKVTSQLFNSSLMCWIFRKIFNAHKILRSDLEALPIYSQFLNKKDFFDEEDYLRKLNLEKKENGTIRIKN